MPATPATPTATEFHKDQAIAWFMHHLTMEQRGRFASALPEAYNALCGREIVVTVRRDDVAHLMTADGGLLRVADFMAGRPATP
jgi:hypothetical protein